MRDRVAASKTMAGKDRQDTVGWRNIKHLGGKKNMDQDLREEALRRGYSPSEVETWYLYDRDPFERTMDSYRSAGEILDDFERDY